jgi:hypothetical protein
MLLVSGVYQFGANEIARSDITVTAAACQLPVPGQGGGLAPMVFDVRGLDCAAPTCGVRDGRRGRQAFDALFGRCAGP